jgi:hypothetical protein
MRHKVPPPRSPFRAESSIWYRIEESSHRARGEIGAQPQKQHRPKLKTQSLSQGLGDVKMQEVAYS